LFLAFLYPFLSTTWTHTNTDRTNATNTTKRGTGFGEILGEGNAEKG
jgi:hypothetical protein